MVGYAPFPIMAKPSQAYYEHYKRQHRVLGAYLALHCWHNSYDAVLVSRETLAHFHEMEKFKDERLRWLRADIQPYFPHITTTSYTKTPSKFAGVALSRVLIPAAFGTESLTDEQRAAQWRKKGFRVAALSEVKTTKTLFTEREAVSFLALMASGLIIPVALPPVAGARLRS